jgi:hypothetical protein
MDWLNQLGGLLQRYNDPSQEREPQEAERDFDQVATQAPRDMLSQGLSAAFRSDNTAPFPQLVGQLFRNSDGPMRSNLLNSMVGILGPEVLSRVLGRTGGRDLPSESGVYNRELTPEDAERVPPEAVEELADQAQQKDPGVIDRISDFYAEHPTLVKSLGAGVLGIAMSHLSKQKRGVL